VWLDVIYADEDGHEETPESAASRSDAAGAEEFVTGANPLLGDKQPCRTCLGKNLRARAGSGTHLNHSLWASWFQEAASRTMEAKQIVTAWTLSAND
jgi:hypothetical protein